VAKLNLKHTLLKTAAAAALMVGIGMESASAATVQSLFNNGPNAASDEDREYLIDNVLTVPGQLDVGDSLRGMMTINTINSGGANSGGTTPNNEWTAVFQAIVLTKVDLAVIGLPGEFRYTFGADPAFAADLCGGQIDCGILGASGFVPGPGALFVFFEDATNNATMDFDDPVPPSVSPPADPDGGADKTAPIDDGTASPRTVPPSSADVSVGPYVTEEDFIETAWDGTHFWTLGFSGPGLNAFGGVAAGPDEGWAAGTTFGDNVLGAFGFASGSVGGLFNVCASLLTPGSYTGTVNDVTPCPIPGVPAGNGFVQFAGSGGIRGVFDLDTTFEVSSNLDLSFNQVSVPEPGTLGLFGLALLGFGWMARRRLEKA
jgi:hypothetical protein